MNAIVPRQSGGLPEPSASLAEAMAGRQRVLPPILPDDSARVIDLHPPTPADVAEARHILPAHEAALQPPRFEHVRQWLLELGGAVRNGPTNGDELDMRAADVVEAAGAVGLPAGAFSRVALAHAKASMTMWPSVADVVAAVTPHATPIRERVAALRRVAGMPESAGSGTSLYGPQNGSAGQVEASASEKQEMAARLRDLSAELRASWRAKVQPADGPAPRPLDPRDLAAMRDADPLVRRAREIAREARDGTA